MNVCSNRIRFYTYSPDQQNTLNKIKFKVELSDRDYKVISSDLVAMIKERNLMDWKDESGYIVTYLKYKYPSITLDPKLISYIETALQPVSMSN